MAQADVALVVAAPPRAARLGLLRSVVHNRRATVGLAIVGLTVVGALVAPHVMPYDPHQPQVLVRLQPPSPEHWMGTDRLGRDVFSRILAGLGLTMQVAVGAVLFGLVIGVPLGALAGYLGRAFDAVVMRLMDAVITFPSRLLAIALVAAAGPNILSLW